MKNLGAADSELLNIKKEETISAQKIIYDMMRGTGDAFKVYSYFTDLTRNDKKSYRLLMIWSGGEHKAYRERIILGGSEERYKELLTFVCGFLRAAGYTGGEHQWVLEIYLDGATYKNHKDDFERLKIWRPKNFKMSFFEDIVPSIEDPDVKEALLHYKDGNPAIASDVLRAWVLWDPAYERNVYLDIDIFCEKIKRTLVGQREMFGLKLTEPGVYIAQYGLPDSNDYLVSVNTPLAAQELIKEALVKSLQHNRIFLSYWRGRVDFITGEKSFDDYMSKVESTIQKLMDFYDTSKSPIVFDLMSGVMESTGPDFWTNQVLPQSKEYFHRNSQNHGVVSDGMWKKGNFLTRQGNIRYIENLLSPQDYGLAGLASKLLKLDFMAYDYFYALNFPSDIAADFLTKLEHEMRTLWHSMDNQKDKRQLAVEKIQGGVKIAQEILFPETIETEQ